MKLRIWTVFLLCFLLMGTALAEESREEGAEFEAAGFARAQRMWDRSRDTWDTAGEGAAVTVTRADGIAGIYVEFDRLPQPWTLRVPSGGTELPCGENGFLHEYVPLSGLPESVTLEFPAGTAIAEVYAFSDGELPDWVQVWQPPCEQADLMLVSSHSDDEQLFFAGILPYYGVERELSVQVVYIVQHFEAYGAADHKRPHEQLDGLWTVGVRNYPIIPRFPDLYSESKDREAALSWALSAYSSVGETYEDFVSYLTECIRRCKPLVAVTHDRNGEYGHGTHVLCSQALTDAVEAASDPEKYPESAALGTWDVEKTYIHLYEENPVVLDLDTPSDRLGGKTPFQVTQDGFACHKSQHWTWFYRWINGTADAPITRAADIQTYSPCRYGLYRSTVGPDEAGGDLFEHVETYPQRAARAEAERLEAERLEAERLEAERLEAERLEEERRQAEEQARAEQERQPAQTDGESGETAPPWAAAAVIAAAVLAVCAGLTLPRKGKGRKKP